MNTWSSGYVSDISYTHGYYGELSPLNTTFAITYAGYCVPPIESACELGFGQGLSINIHACSQTVKWWGTDFNPAQAAFAQGLSERCGNQAILDDAAFTEFCRRDDLPEFDFIALHGIWSWISDENRQVIVNFLSTKLKVGGVLYISYNTQPGWGAAIPMRDLMTDYVKLMTPPGKGIATRIDEALEFTEKLFATNPAYIKANPAIPERFKKMKGHDRKYLAHEYFNQDWLPMSFSKINNWLTQAKLSYVCSANLLDQIDTLNLTTEQQGLLNSIPDIIFRQTVRDFMINQQFRKDLWIKGPRQLTPFEKVELLRKQNLILLRDRKDVSLKLKGISGEVTLQETIYGPILDALADHQPKSLGQLEEKLRVANSINFRQLTEAALILIGSGIAGLSQDLQNVQKVKKSTESLNSEIKNRSRSQNEIQYLASPVTGGGIGVPRFGQLFLEAIQLGKKNPQEWASYVWELLQVQGQKIIKEGKTLESVEENLNELIEQAKTFEAKQLPILRALRIS